MTGQTKCEICDKEVSTKFFFCPFCGDQLKEPSDEKAFGEAQDYENKEIVCKNCSLEHDKIFPYCPWCGQHYEEQPEEYPKKGKTEPIVEYG